MVSLEDKVKQGRRPVQRMSSQEFEARMWNRVDKEVAEGERVVAATGTQGEPEAVQHPEPAPSHEDYDGSEPNRQSIEVESVGLRQITNRAFTNDSGTFFVRSSTTTGKFYMVVDGSCTCKGYTYRQTCNHVTHLEKAGYLVHDLRNGGYLPAEGGNPLDRALKVTTGIRHSLPGEGEEIASRDAQIRRIQNFARAQQRVIAEQRRLIASFRTQSEAGMRRTTKMLEIASGLMDERAAELISGDLVELDV